MTRLAFPVVALAGLLVGFALLEVSLEQVRLAPVRRQHVEMIVRDPHAENDAGRTEGQQRVLVRPDQRLHASFFLKMVQPPNRGDDPLLDLALVLVVLDDLQVLILAGFFDSCKHGSLLFGHSHYYRLDPYMSMLLFYFCGTTVWRSENTGLYENRHLEKSTG